MFGELLAVSACMAFGAMLKKAVEQKYHGHVSPTSSASTKSSTPSTTTTCVRTVIPADARLMKDVRDAFSSSKENEE